MPDSGKLSLSPDGRWLAFPIQLTAGDGVVVYDLANCRAHVLKTSMPGGGLGEFEKDVWLPDSSKLYLGDAFSRFFTQVVDLRQPVISVQPVPEAAGNAQVFASLTCSDCGPGYEPVLEREPGEAAKESPYYDEVTTRVLSTYHPPLLQAQTMIDHIYASPNGKRLLCDVSSSGGGWGTADQWFYLDLTNRSSAPVKILDEDRGPAYCAVWSADSTKAYGLCADGRIVLVSLN